MKVRRRAGLFSKFFNAVASASCVVAVGEETGGGQGFSRGLLVRDVSSGEASVCNKLFLSFCLQSINGT